MMKIDYIIPTYNSGKFLDLCISSIKAYGNPREIIVVDKWSTDKTIPIAEDAGCLIIQSNETLGAARYHGAELAETEFISFIDADVEITRDWTKLLDYSWPADCGIISGHYSAPHVMWGLKPPFKVTNSVGFIACSITKIKDYLACPSVKNFHAAEDNAYATCLRKRGLYWYVLDAPVHHHSYPEPKKFAWWGSGYREQHGWDWKFVKKLLGGAVLGINQRFETDSYIENWQVRGWEFVGYCWPERYKEYER